MPNYYLVSLSNRHNLELCIRHALAGFTNSGNGFWTFLEIEEGDFLSFLYGAEAWNLYRVAKKFALKDAAALPPWPPVTFRTSGKTYYFPFRLSLEPVRNLQESVVRREFRYVARNLLLRGGYRKTHFQADQTTLQSVSQMGQLYRDSVEPLSVNAELFTPLLTFNRSEADPPTIYQFSESTLQALVKKHLRQRTNLGAFLSPIGLVHLTDQPVDVLGELALPEGQVDVIVKEAVPLGASTQVAVEVKLGAAYPKDVEQLAQYVTTIGNECKAGILIAREASRRVVSHAQDRGLQVVVYWFDGLGHAGKVTFEELCQAFRLEPPG